MKARKHTFTLAAATAVLPFFISGTAVTLNANSDRKDLIYRNGGKGGGLFISLAPFDRVPFCALFREIVFRVHTNDGMEREANRV